MRCSSDGHLRAFFSSTKPVQWLVLVFVSVLARTPRVSASASVTGGSGAMTSCGTPFVDTASSALLADVVLEGRVREKVYPPGQPGGPGSGRYNVSIQVRKQMWKGRELVNKGKRPRKLLLGIFTSPQDSPLVTAAALSDNNNNIDDVDSDDTNVVVNPAAAVGGTGGSSVGGVGGGGDDDGDVRLVDCVADVADGATYIFFLRDVRDKKGRYFEISAVPVKKNRRVSRIVSKILKNNGAQPPRIQRVKGPKRVTKGSSMTLRCKAKAKPTPLFTWYRNGLEIKSGRGQRIKNSKRGSRLKVSRVDTDDSGVYTCLARNAVGEASKNVTVKVRGSELSDHTYNFYEYMNEDANATDYVSVTAPEMIHKACEKQTFCFNGGTCRYIPDLQQTFCQCPESYEGKRCEKEVAHPSILKGEATLLYERTLIIVGIVIALLVFVVICIASYFLANRRRKRWEKRRRVKQTLDHQGDPLLDNTDGNMQPQFLPGNRPRAQKETQTDNDIHPPDLPPPKRENESEPNFINHPVNSGNIFRDHSFPLITSAAATTTATPPPSGPSQRPARPVSDKELRDPEKRESRLRLKAVSVDDNCKDRPRSWQRSSDVPDSKSMPIITDGDPAEAIEMDTFGPRPTSNSSPKLSVGDNDDDSGGGGGGGGSGSLPGFLSSIASPELRPVPAKTERQPRDNAHAQLKTPEEEVASFTHPAVLPPPDYYDLQEPLLARQPGNQKGADPAPPGTEEMLPVNGVQEDWDSDGDEPDTTPLPLLHISEEDLNGNVSKLDSFDSEFLPPPPLPPPEKFATEPVSHSPPPPPAHHRPKNLTTALVDGVYVPQVGRSSGSLSEDDSAGFLPNTLSSTEAGSPLLEDTPPGEAYAFDPCTYSDPDDLDEQFMHGSPKKGSGGLSGAEDKQDYERRLRNVRADQEAIPI